MSASSSLTAFLMALPSLHTLRVAAARGLTRRDFRHVRWAGIFGSFVQGTANESSDVDVVVIEAPYDWSVTKQLLEDALPVEWSRAVDVIRIGQGQTELRGYIQLESLLASRTIFLQDDEAREEVACHSWTRPVSWQRQRRTSML